MYDFEIEEAGVTVAGTDDLIPGKKVILRKWAYNKVTPLAIVSKRYQVIKHADVVNQFEQALDTVGGNFVNRTVTTSLPHYGAKMFRKYTFNDVALEFEPGDLVKLCLELTNSYDGVMRAGFNLIGHRLVCENGLIIGEKMQSIHAKHFSSFDLKDLSQRLENSIPMFEQALEHWKEWRNIAISTDGAVEMLKKSLIPAKTQLEIIEKFKSEQPNKWGLFQAATWVTSHKYEAKNPENTRLSRHTAEGTLIPIFYGRKIGGRK